MSKRLILTEDEKKNIRSLYNLNEEDSSTDQIGPIGQMVLKALDDIKKGVSKSTDSVDKSTTNSSDTKIDKSKLTEKGRKLLDNPVFKKKLREISDAINIPENSIIKLMKHESGLDPTIKNSIGCVGLIQFCPSSGAVKTINGKQYSLEDLRYNLEAQMDAIKQFWLSGYKNGKIKKPADLYIYNFFPVAAGKPDDFVIQAKGLSATKVANSNPVFNRVLGRERSSPLTVGLLNQYYQKTGMV
jgi:hypothetical protein